MAIEKGNTDAMITYAKMLENGDGVDANKEEALKYYRMASEWEKIEKKIYFSNDKLKMCHKK